jgi:hypothetical protein
MYDAPCSDVHDNPISLKWSPDYLEFSKLLKTYVSIFDLVAALIYNNSTTGFRTKANSSHPRPH